MAKQYLDLTGLQSVIGQIKTYYSGSTSASPRVGWAQNALSANEALTLHDPQNFSITGDVTASAVSFNGSEPVVLTAAIADASPTVRGLMTTAYATKLEGIATGAQVNVIESVSVTVASTTSTTVPSSTVSGKAVTIELPQYALKTDITSAMKIKKVVDYYKDIATDDPNPEIGDVYIVRYQGTSGQTALNAEYVYAASGQWEEFGNTVILEGYATQAWVNNHDWNAADITDWASTTVPVLHAGDAEKLKTAQVINFTGDVNDTSISFDGSSSVTATLTIENGAISNAHIASNAAIAQSKISGLTTDLAAKIPKIGSTDATAHAGEVATIQADGTITFGGIKAQDLVSSSGISTMIATAIGDLEYAGSTTGYYVTQVTETDGVIDVTREAKGTAAASGSLDGVSKLIDGDTVDTAFTGSFYITSIPSSSLTSIVANTTAV